MLDEAKIRDLEEKAKQCRRDILTQMLGSGGGHLGPSLSIVELCVALYFHHARLNPENPDWELRDRIVLSKAHACETIYSCLARRGFFSPDLLPKYKHLGSPLQGHADAWATRGLEYSGGSLGQGLGFCVGLALAARIKSPYNILRRGPDYQYRVYCICGDGETHEGKIWEAAMAAGYYKLSNLVNIIDYNQFSARSSIVGGMDLEPLAEKWRAFGWWTTEIDGHNFREIIETLEKIDKIAGMPKCIIAHTIKGKGIPYYEKTHEHMISFTQKDYDKLVNTIY
jgi:transketolase